MLFSRSLSKKIRSFRTTLLLRFIGLSFIVFSGNREIINWPNLSIFSGFKSMIRIFIVYKTYQKTFSVKLTRLMTMNSKRCIMPKRLNKHTVAWCLTRCMTFACITLLNIWWIDCILLLNFLWFYSIFSTNCRDCFCFWSFLVKL